MALRACLLLAVLALANAQDDGSSVDMGDYDTTLAMNTRRSHFYCLDEGRTRDDFPTDERGGNNNQITIFRRWTVLLQYPVLSYLDSMRKPALVDNIALLAGRDPDEVCIATVDNYRVSYYDESVLVSLYFLEVPGDNTTIIEEESVLNALNDRFRDSFRAEGPYVRRFLDRYAIIVNTTRSGQPNQNIHPGAVMDGDYDPARDPTLNAVPIASFVGNVSLDYALSRRGDREYMIQDFAENPNPRVLGLEAGDIVFAVFGSIFLVLLTIAIFMGYCIHPFFLS